MKRGTGALIFGFALLWCAQAMAQDAEERQSRRHRRDDSAEQAEDGEESSSERRKRRREERARRKAEEAAAREAKEGSDGRHAGATTAAGGPTPPEGPGDAAPAPGATAVPPAAAVTGFPPVIYEAKAEDGAPPYAQSEVLEGEGALDVRRLPPAQALALTEMQPEQLRKLDGRLGMTLEELQAGDSCTALRTASRVPPRSWIAREHQRELLVIGGLFVLALFTAFGFRSPAMRAIMPMVPFLACLYLGYDTLNRTDERIEGIARGLRACSASLGEGSAEKPQVVRERLEKLTRVRDHIDAAYERENGLVARVMDQYRM